jgi:hypothetical protein
VPIRTTKAYRVRRRLLARKAPSRLSKVLMRGAELTRWERLEKRVY